MAPVTDPRVVRTRAVVLGATVELLARRGITATTIEAVAERSGVAKTTIYRHWDSQPELVRDAFDSIRRPPPDPDTGTLRGDLIALLTGLVMSMVHGPAIGLMFSLIDAAERDPAYAEVHRRAAATRHAVILQVLARGISRGELPPDTDPGELLDLLAGPIFYRRAVSAGTVDPGLAERVVDRVLAAYGAGRRCSGGGGSVDR